MLELRLEEAGHQFHTVKRRMRQPWPLGYMHGVALAFARQADVPSDSHAADVIATSIYVAGLGRIASAEAKHIIGNASSDPEFVEGCKQGVSDTVVENATEAEGLIRWLEQG